MKPIVYLILCMILVSSCQQNPPQESVTINEGEESLNTLFENYYEERLKLFPLEATAIADNRYNDQLPNDISEDYRGQLREFYSKYLNQLDKVDKSKLSRQEQLSYDIFKRDMQVYLKGLEFNDHYMPIQQFWGLTLTLPQLGSGQSNQPFKTPEDYENFLGRIKGFTVWADTAIVNMKKGLKSGEVYPKILMERVLPQLEAMMVKDPTKSIFYQPITNMPDTFSAEAQAQLKEAYIKAIQEDIVPAYTKLHTFIKNEYIPNTRTTAGISAIPQGEERYRYLINYWTTTNLSPNEIYETGLSEVARIKGEMEKVKEQVGFKGSLNEFFEFVNNDPQFTPFKTDQEVIEAYKAIEKKMQPQLSKLFNLVPKSKFEVRQTEEFREASASAEYNPGAPDGSRPGIFYVPILDPTTYNSTDMETLFLHEAIPGHHYQISLQQENEDLPKFRRFGWYGSYGEGWALYSESLGKELGLYTDPYQYFGNLGDEMHRAIRLVVDVGMHMKGWTREQAIDYMVANEAISKENATAEIERYMAIPGQALSYKIGQLKIIELRKKAEEALGEKFDISRFHDEVLKDGGLPLSILEEKIDKWIASEKKGNK